MKPRFITYMMRIWRIFGPPPGIRKPANDR